MAVPLVLGAARRGASAACLQANFELFATQKVGFRPENAVANCATAKGFAKKIRAGTNQL
jgi:hypothetical protein